MSGRKRTPGPSDLTPLADLTALSKEARATARTIIREDQWYTRDEGPPSVSTVFGWVAEQQGNVAAALESRDAGEARHSCGEVASRTMMLAERLKRGGLKDVYREATPRAARPAAKGGDACLLIALADRVGVLAAWCLRLEAGPRGRAKRARRKALEACYDVVATALRLGVVGDAAFPMEADAMRASLDTALAHLKAEPRAGARGQAVSS